MKDLAISNPQKFFLPQSAFQLLSRMLCMMQVFIISIFFV